MNTKLSTADIERCKYYMEKYLEDSLALITSALENEDPDKLLADFLEFEKNAVGPTCDELIASFNLPYLSNIIK